MTFQQLKKVVAFYTRFTLSFTQIGYRARSLFWQPLQPSFAGQHWIVTGASGGLGREIVMAAARAGATVTAVARDKVKLEEMRAAAVAAGIHGVRVALCDFSLQQDTHRFMTQFAASGTKIDVLVNNVGVLLDEHSMTSEGRENSYVISFLSHYLLTEGLIKRGAFVANRALVINMTSGGGYNVPLSTAMLNMTKAETFNGTAAYGFHKRGQMVLNQYWRDTYGSRGMTFYVMHPGWADTDGVKRSLPRFRKILKSVLRDAKSGSDTAIWLAATRPPQSEAEQVWFDRKIRTAHVYPRTRVTNDTAQSLVAYLEADLQRLPNCLP